MQHGERDNTIVSESFDQPTEGLQVEEPKIELQNHNVNAS
jgi:hypothetical protein